MPNFRTKIPNHFDLPRRIHRLGELAYNLWWTWNPYAQRLFYRIDYALWERLNHNPLLFLRSVGRSEVNAAAQDPAYLEMYDQAFANFDAYLDSKYTWSARTYKSRGKYETAYFSMEFGVHETLPIYSGGLGVLAGDYLKEASDLGLPLVGVGLMYAQGYFSQRISEDGWQEAINNPLNFDDLPVVQVVDKDEKPLSIAVKFPDRTVTAQIFELRVGRIPLYLLDTDLDENTPADRNLTLRLYYSDLDLRIAQEVMLGVGGVRALRALGYNPDVWHMNEGHAAFLTLERARELVAQGETFAKAIARTRHGNIFTTHTPVPAGNDEFPLWLVDKNLSNFWTELGLSRDQFVDLARHQQSWGETFSMPILALRNSDGRNAVSELHGRVSRRMWKFLWPEVETEDEVPITSVTNGVHTATWMARRVRVLLNKYLGEDWLERLDDPETWVRMDAIPDRELWEVRLHLKRKLVLYVMERTRQRWMKGGYHPIQAIASGVMLDPYVLTIGFARRFATYKRASLVFSDLDRLLELINRPNRAVQIVFAGKAHPADEPGKLLIQEVYRIVKKAEDGGRLVFLEDYDMNLARYLVQGVDVWMNNPRRPNEASGTSGMKAALNGALNFSVLDGWWREAFNGSNGWAIGPDADLDSAVDDKADADSLYDVLENQLIPLYYNERNPENVPVEWMAMMKESMRTITPLFSTRRMMKEYIERLYLPAKK
ncbi:MAG TPA: alpha-glucan family phosphorylase [Anaerolineales bacterium]|nr:alpha-glucan family phosphorylase [Anaerolineales bacterium]